MRVAGVVLAAGASRRLGEAKQLVMLAGERLLERAARVAREAGLRPVIVVLGAEGERIRAECELGDAVVVVNEGWSEGMGSSVRVGVGAVPGGSGVVVMTCDQPAVTAEHLLRLMEGDEISGSGYAGRLGVPAFFPAASVGMLAELGGDAGARGALGKARAVGLAGGEVDVDTAESLAEARRRFGGA